jgi:hypothetical protein
LLNKIDYPSLYGSDRVFKRANTEDAVVGNRSTGKTWSAPPQGWVKANWDAAVDRDKGLTGLGVIVRDHSRLPFATKALTNVGYLAPEDAEALAALAATKLCEEMGFDQIHFVGDAKVVVDGVTTGDLDAIRP